MKAEVKRHNGTPTLFLNDQPVYANCQLLGGIDPKGLADTQACIRAYAKNGVHIYSIDSVGDEWYASRNPYGPYDFSPVAERLRAVMDADPEALFLLRMGFETRGTLENWWNNTYPEELELLS